MPKDGACALLITSGQSNLTIAFARWRQYPPTTAHWRHLANTIELVLPSAHSSPQPKRQLDRFSRFCTAYGGVSILYNGRPSPPKLPLAMGDLDPI